jgi:hypothetical protein
MEASMQNDSEQKGKPIEFIRGPRGADSEKRRHVRLSRRLLLSPRLYLDRVWLEQ